MTDQSNDAVILAGCFEAIADEIRERLFFGGDVRSLKIKRMILPPDLQNSLVGSSKLAAAEMLVQIDENYLQNVKTWTYLVFFDPEEQIMKGVLKISGQLSCNLPEFLSNYLIPLPDNDLFDLENLRAVIPVHLSSLPGISSIHRRSGQNFNNDLHERNYRSWNVKMRDLALNARPPSPNPWNKKSKKKSKVPAEPKSCPVLDILIDEHYNFESRLSKLPIEIIETVYSHVVNIWAKHIETRGIFASIVSKVKFPKPQGINVNMMPIVLCDKRSIPDNMKQYLPLLAACPINREEYHEVGYLTIQESIIVEDGKSQRRGGVHTETPGKIWLEPYRDPTLDKGLEGNWSMQVEAPMTIGWGRGELQGLYDEELGTHYEYVGGLYMASNVSDSCRVWNCKVTNPEEIVGPLGDLEHMASYLGEGETLKEGDMVWMTDCTPHESLPLEKGTHRQYFRLVTSQVSVWYADHSTPNPLGITPPGHVKVVHGNKFEVSKK